MKFIVLLLLVLLLGLQYRLWLGSGNLLEVEQYRQIKETRQAENASLLERNRSLAAEVLDLKQGMEAIEEKARSELGMVKNSETFYQIVDESRTETPASQEY